MKKNWKPLQHKRSDGKSFVHEDRKPEQRWEYDRSKAATVRRRHPATNRPNDFANVFGDYRTEMEPREHCNNVTGKQGSKVPVASFKTRNVSIPMEKTLPEGTKVKYWLRVGKQHIVSVTSYGSTVIFKKMVKSATIRDSRDGKSHHPVVVRAELSRLLGLDRGEKGFALLMGCPQS